MASWSQAASGPGGGQAGALGNLPPRREGGWSRGRGRQGERAPSWGSGAFGEDFPVKRVGVETRKCWVNGCPQTLREESIPGRGRSRSEVARRQESPRPGERTAAN